MKQVLMRINYHNLDRNVRLRQKHLVSLRVFGQFIRGSEFYNHSINMHIIDTFYIGMSEDGIPLHNI